MLGSRTRHTGLSDKIWAYISPKSLQTCLTVYDIQTLRNPALSGIDSDNAEKSAVHGALPLYLNFIGIFLNVLRLLNSH